MANDRDRNDRPGRRGPRGPTPSTLDAAGFKRDVLEGDPSKIDSRADELGKQIVQDQLNPSQVRNFYGAVAKLRAEVEGRKRLRQLRMHRSRLAYLTARAQGPADARGAVAAPLPHEGGAAALDARADVAA